MCCLAAQAVDSLMYSLLLAAELRKSLPPMVIEIIEERLETDYVERASSLMMMDFGSGDASSSTAKTEPKTKPKTEPEPEPEATSEFPSDWEPMGKDEVRSRGGHVKVMWGRVTAQLVGG